MAMVFHARNDTLVLRRSRHYIHEPVRRSPICTKRPKSRRSCGLTHFVLDSVFSAFFRKGQVLETFRGKGIYQTAVDKAIENLNQGEWVCQQGTIFFHS